jgi:hypothetical protein
MLLTILLMYALPFIVLTVLVECEWFGIATTGMIISMGVYTWLNKITVLPYLKEHYAFCLQFVGVYLLAGVIWSFTKWFLFLMKFRGKFREEKDKFLVHYKLPAGTSIPDELREAFIREIRYVKVNGQYLHIVPSASDFKAKIIAWMAFWPCSMIGFVLNDPVRRLFNYIFLYLKGSYQKMADSILSDSDFKK